MWAPSGASYGVLDGTSPIAKPPGRIGMTTHTRAALDPATAQAPMIRP
jgi:hypothetical protein